MIPYENFWIKCDFFFAVCSFINPINWYSASDYPSETDGARFQMRLSYSPAAQFLLFMFKWTDCHLAGALGLLRVLVYKVHLLHLYLEYTFFFSFRKDIY